MKLSEHFDDQEFRCHNGDPLPDDFAATIKDTVDFLERLRGFMNFYLFKIKKNPAWLDLGITIVSGHRSLAYNRRIGSSDTSQHVAGKAADVIPSVSFRLFGYSEWYAMAELVAKSYGKDRPYRLGKYNRSKFVHVDCGYGHGGLRWTK